MNSVKRSLIYVAGLLTLGTILIVFSVKSEGDNTYLTGLGGGMLGAGIVKLIQMVGIMKNPEQIKRYNNMQTEERAVFIANKAGNIAFSVSVVAELAALIYFSAKKNSDIQDFLTWMLCVQCALKVILYRVYNYKY